MLNSHQETTNYQLIKYINIINNMETLILFENSSNEALCIIKACKYTKLPLSPVSIILMYNICKTKINFLKSINLYQLARMYGGI